MVKQGTKKPRKLATSDRFPLIEKELRKQTKGELVAMILAIAKQHAVVSRELEGRLTIEKPIDLLVADVSSAIDRATDFDERRMNHNFEVDWQAYEEVQKGLALLVKLGYLADAKSLALKLMKDGSYQVECSDEGLMSDDISECLNPVIRAVKAAGGGEAVKWARAMQTADRVGFICDNELAGLRDGNRN
ncbi:MAG: hypothetical protein K8T91_09905 [Planctomycetes bacterium]|nr:hypothetical protein [Planctomycetota bacterium]